MGNGRQMPKGRLTHSEVRAKGDLSQLFIPKFRKTTILQLWIWYVHNLSMVIFLVYGVLSQASVQGNFQY